MSKLDNDPPLLSRPTYRPVLSKNLVGVIASIAVFVGTIAAIFSVICLVDAALDHRRIHEMSETVGRDVVHEIEVVDCTTPQEDWRALACQLQTGPADH